MTKGRLFRYRSDKLKDILVGDLKSFIVDFEKAFKLPLYLSYGTLLGTVRQGNFIARDDDIDLAYLSKYHTIPEVFKEMLKIYSTLEKRGLLIDRGQGGGYGQNCGHAHILSINKRTEFDVWTSWIGKDKKYYFWSMGMGLPKGHLLPLVLLKLRGFEFKVPHKYKRVLAYLYGEDWRMPKAIKSYHYRPAHLTPLNEIILKSKKI